MRSPATRSLFSVALSLLLTACAAAPPASVATPQPAPITAPPAPAVVSVAGSWTWECCAAEPGRYFGNLLLAQEGSTLHGVFVDDASNGEATYVEGQIEGRRVTFTRQWFNADVGQPYRQLYSLDLDTAGAVLTGSFTQPHAPGSPIPMRYARGYKPVLPRRGASVCGPAPRAATPSPAGTPPRETKEEPVRDLAPKSAVSKAFKVCPGGSSFTCAPVSPGAPPFMGETSNNVCGCKPRCASAEFLYVTAAVGQWPDGSQKGELSCVHSGLPTTR